MSTNSKNETNSKPLPTAMDNNIMSDSDNSIDSSDSEILKTRLKKLREGSDYDSNTPSTKKSKKFDTKTEEKNKKEQNNEFKDNIKKTDKENNNLRIISKSITKKQHEKKNILFKCVICGNKMPSLASLKAHIKRQHPKK